MRPKKNPLFLALSLLTLVQVGCEKPASLESGEPSPSFLPFQTEDPFPIKRVIHDNRGRPLDGTIVGKTADQLYVTRGHDGMNFKIEIDSLAEADRKFAEGLSLKTPPGEFQLGLPPSTEIPPYIASRKDAIKRLEDDNSRLLTEAEVSKNSMLRSSRNNEIDRNNLEIGKLKSAIEDYLTRHPEYQSQTAESQ